MAAIERLSLRTQVLEELRRLILEGELSSGNQIRESRLAAELGVSRTPVREALHRLEQEGLVTNRPGKGFAVAILSAEEAQELYPLRALLEPVALRLSGLPDQETMRELRRLNSVLARTPKGPTWIDADDRWHDLLIANCGNRHLIRMIGNLRRLTRRYEFAFSQATEDRLEASAEQHQLILQRLSDGDLDEACDLLADNMVVGVEAVLRWLQARGSVE